MEVVVQSGYLFKKGGLIPSYKKRWFVLTQDALIYYKKQNDTRGLGVVSHRDMIRCQDCERELEMEGQVYIEFNLFTRRRTYVLYCEKHKQKERQRWIQNLSRVMQRKHQQPSSTDNSPSKLRVEDCCIDEDGEEL
jgi:hypothetical protein